MQGESSNCSYWVSASLTAADGKRIKYCFVDRMHNASDADLRVKSAKSKANVLLSLLMSFVYI